MRNDEPAFFVAYTLTQILNGLIKTGLTIEAMPSTEWRDQMHVEMKRPMMLLVKAGKQ